MVKTNLRSERKEALMRILVAIVSGIILGAWKIFVQVLRVIHFIYVLITGKRSKDFADLSETWNTQWYYFQRYMLFVNNDRPFPFGKLKKSMSKFSL